MNANFWGPAAWIFFHSIAENYPDKPTEEEKESHKKFISLLPSILPCPHCRESFAIYMDQFPPDPYLHSRDQFTFWLYQIHDIVNNKLERQHGHKIKSPSYQKVRSYYSSKKIKRASK